MMSKWLLTGILLGIFAAPAAAQVETVHSAHASGDDNDLGVGLIVGATSGVTAKYYYNRQIAFDAAIGSYHHGFGYEYDGVVVQGGFDESRNWIVTRTLFSVLQARPSAMTRTL